MNYLKGQSINIEIDSDDGTYNIDFIGCKLTDAYKVLQTIIKEMESGDFFIGELSITNESGEPLSAADARDIIAGIKEEIDSSRSN